MKGRIVILAALACSGCGPMLSPAGLGPTPGELASAHGYVPLDPLPIDQIESDSCLEVANGASDNGSLLNALPDLTIRFAVAEFNANGSMTFGPSKITAKGKTYRAVLDYINADNVPVDFYVRRIVRQNGNLGVRELWRPLEPTEETAGYEARISPAFLQKEAQLTYRKTPEALNPFISYIDKGYTESQIDRLVEEGYTPITMPIYVGVGLRLSADIRALDSGVALSGLGAIGAGADADRLAGTLTVQSLGVNGKAIATTLPLPNKLDQTTIENAILSIGTSRATLYTANTSNGSQDGVIATPRVVGLYSPIGSDPQLINAIYSELSRVRPKWPRPCVS